MIRVLVAFEYDELPEELGIDVSHVTEIINRSCSYLGREVNATRAYIHDIQDEEDSQ